jgi:carbamoyl-phosphate synthase small subunit
MCSEPCNWRSKENLPQFLKDHGVVAIEGIDTRALVRHIRESGAMTAVLSTLDLDAESLVEKARSATSLSEVNFVEKVSREKSEPYQFHPLYSFAKEAPKEERYHVVAYDCGVKNAILDGLVQAGCRVDVVPWNTPAEEVLAQNPDGVFLSNGPGDPERVEGTFVQVEKLLGKVPIFGICLGHQMLGKAAGAEVEKLKYGHRGSNHPVMNLLTKRVEITVQNHGFSLVFPSLGKLESGEEHINDLRGWTKAEHAPVVNNEKFGRIQLTHVNLNDGTIEGMRFLDVPAFSVQYHPEAAPGSTDSQYLFTAFTQLMDEWKQGTFATSNQNSSSDYLAIDRASNRLEGWMFGSKEREN